MQKTILCIIHKQLNQIISTSLFEGKPLNFKFKNRSCDGSSQWDVFFLQFPGISLLDKFRHKEDCLTCLTAWVFSFSDVFVSDLCSQI